MTLGWSPTHAAAAAPQPPRFLALGSPPRHYVALAEITRVAFRYAGDDPDDDAAEGITAPPGTPIGATLHLAHPVEGSNGQCFWEVEDPAELAQLRAVLDRLST